MDRRREFWDSRLAFVMAAIGSAVGLGNVWRFPYVAYANGGGAFLIPYFVALITAGIPLLVLEFGLGHMMQGSAPFSFSRVSKKWEPLGWWAVLVGFGIVTYYAVIMAWCFAYLFFSLKVAWGGNAETFFYQTFLSLSSGPGELGGLRPPILLGLLITWLSIFFIIIKGTKSVGRVVMVTVPLPVILLVIMVVRGLTLPGAMEGLRYYLYPDFNVLFDPGVWLAAYSQIFFSLTIGFGVMIAYAGYLPRKSDVTNNAFITALADCGVSFFAGFAVFSTLGYLALKTGTGVEAVVQSGPGLSFVTYPTVISLMPFGASIIGLIFFLMLLTLGIDSAFSLVEAGVSASMDKWPRVSRIRINTLICVAAFIIGLLFTTRGGLYWLDIVDHFLNNYGLALVGLFQCIAIGYVFGAGRLRAHLNDVSEIKVGRWWDFFIKFLIPAVLVISLLLTVIKEVREPYEGYPRWALFVGGWFVAALAIVLAFVFVRIRGKEEE